GPKRVVPMVPTERRLQRVMSALAPDSGSQCMHHNFAFAGFRGGVVVGSQRRSERNMHVSVTSDAVPLFAAPVEGALPEGVARRAGARWEPAPAVTPICREHYRSLVRLAALLVADKGTAEDVVQDSFVAMHNAWGRLRDTDKGLPYLRQSVVNRSRSV